MRPQNQNRRGPLVLALALTTAVVMSVAVWVGPQLAVWVNTGRWFPLGFWQPEGAVLRAMFLRHPALALPVGLRRALPPPGEFWTVQVLWATILLSLATA